MSEEFHKLKKEFRLESILDTALKVMSEKGIEGTTMREIANAEGISETLLYRFFQNKQELLFTIIRSRLSQTIKEFEDFVETIKGMIPDPIISLPIIWKLAMKKILINKELILLIIKERENMGQYFEKFREQFQNRGEFPFRKELFTNLRKMQIDTHIIDYFKRCQDAGNLRKDIDPKYLFHTFIKLMNPIFLPPPFSLPEDLSEEKIEQIMQNQLNIFLYGIIPNEKK